MEIKPIPGFRGYLASSTGEIFDPEGKTLVQYTQKDKYKTCMMRLSNGEFQTLGVHRLICLAFHGEPTSTLQVNHRNGVVDDNNSTNLEWVTQKQNNIHAKLLAGVSVRGSVVITNAVTGQQHLFNTGYEVAGFLSVGILDIWDAIKDDATINDWSIEYLTCNSPKPKAFHKPTGMTTGIKISSKGVMVRDLEKDEVLSFPSLGAAGQYFETSASHIFVAISRDSRKRLFRKRYKVWYSSDAEPVYTQEEIDKAMSLGSRATVAYDVSKSKTIIFDSAKEAIETIGVSARPVQKCLAAGTLRNFDGWVFSYLDVFNVEEVKKYVASLVAS